MSTAESTSADAERRLAVERVPSGLARSLHPLCADGVSVSPLPARLTIRSTFEFQALDYDSRRFFDTHGFPDMDLSTQIGAVLEQFRSSVSASYTPGGAAPGETLRPCRLDTELTDTSNHSLW